MSPAERERLTRPELSHQARSLYLLYLRPRADDGTVRLSLPEMANYLLSTSGLCPTPGRPELAQGCLAELQALGLVTLPPTGTTAGGTLSLPFCAAAAAARQRSRPFALTEDWRPGATFAAAALLGGLPDAAYGEAELRGFVAYWARRPETRTQTGWERAFVQRLARRRGGRARR